MVQIDFDRLNLGCIDADYFKELFVGIKVESYWRDLQDIHWGGIVAPPSSALASDYLRGFIT